MLNWELLREEAVEQHAALVNILKRLKVEVLYFEHLIDEAIEETRRHGTFGTWVKEVVRSSLTTSIKYPRQR
jgi:arginine deiminase